MGFCRTFGTDTNGRGASSSPSERGRPAAATPTHTYTHDTTTLRGPGVFSSHAGQGDEEEGTKKTAKPLGDIRANTRAHTHTRACLSFVLVPSSPRPTSPHDDSLSTASLPPRSLLIPRDPAYVCTILCGYTCARARVYVSFYSATTSVPKSFCRFTAGSA